MRHCWPPGTIGSKADRGPAPREPSVRRGRRTGDQRVPCVSWCKKKKKKKIYGEDSSEEKWWATESSGCYFKYNGQVLVVCSPIYLPYYNLSSRNQASHIESTKYTMKEGMKVTEGHPYQAVRLLEKPSSVTIPDRCMCGQNSTHPFILSQPPSSAFLSPPPPRSHPPSSSFTHIFLSAQLSLTSGLHLPEALLKSPLGEVCLP